MVEEIIDASLRASVCLHDVLHGLRTVSGIGTAILGLNKVQELASVYQDPLLLVFLYLWKAYNDVYFGHLLMLQERYGKGPHMCKLLTVF